MGSKKWYFVLILVAFVLVSSSSILPNNNQFIETYLTNPTDLIRTPSADGDNWLTGWQYRKQLNFYEVAGAGTGYAIKATVYHDVGDGADGPRAICTEGHARTDFGDIRFTRENGDTLLGYYRYEYTTGDTAIFWFKMDESLETGQTGTAYVYYGKAAATYDGDGDDVFDFFDDFEDNNLNKWDSNLNMEIKTDRESPKYGSYSVAADVVGNPCNLRDNDDVSYATDEPFAFHYELNSDNVLRGGTILFYTVTDYTEYAGYSRGGYDSSPAYYYFYDGTMTQWSGTQILYSDTWYEIELKVDLDSSDPDYKGSIWNMAGTPLAILPEEDWHETDDSDPESITFTGPSLTSQYNYRSWYDNVWVRKLCYAAEPYFGTPEAEEDTTPVNDVLPACTNPDDTDNLYAQLRTYIFTSSHQDVEGYDTIEYVELSLSTAETPYWTARYTEGTDTYSEEVGADYIELLEGSESKSGINLDITWNIRIEVAHVIKWNHELMVKVVDEATLSDIDETDGEILDVFSFIFITTPDNWITADAGGGTIDHGDVNGEFTVSDTVHYNNDGAPSALHPPDGAYTWWVICDAVATSPWNSDSTGAEGAFSVTADADDEIGADVYTLKAVAYGDNEESANRFTAAETDTYTADRVIVTGYSGISSDRVDVGTYGNMAVTLEYELGGAVESGTVTVNGLSGTWLSGPEHWQFAEVKYTTQDFTYDTVATSGNTHGITVVNQDSQTYEQIWDRIILTMTSNYDWTIIDHNVTLSATGIFEYDSEAWSGVITWDDRYPSESTVDSYNYGTSQITSVTDPTHDLSVFHVGTEVTVIFDDVVISGDDPTYYWVQYSEDRVWLQWGINANFIWDYNNSPVFDGMIIQSYMNDTESAAAPISGGGIAGIGIGHFDTSWYYAEITICAEFTVIASYNLTIWTDILEVDILHSLQIVTWSLVVSPNGDQFWITFQTNRLNASITVWDTLQDSGTLFSDNIYHSTFEGMHQVARNQTIGNHELTFCITSTDIEYDRVYTEHPYTWWYNITDVIAAGAPYDSYIIILNNLYEVIDFDTFEVYNNGTRIYHNVIQTIDTYVYNITIANRFGDKVNSTEFIADESAAHDFVAFVSTYSFKFMNWYNGFLRVNVTRAGVTYSEIIMPTEIIEFNLFAATYIFSVDFLNGTTKFSQEITVSNSTGYVITGDTLTDVFDLVTSTYAMTNAINITVTTTSNNVITIELNLENINSTLYTQTVNILTNVVNVNSTIYDQTVSLISQLSSVNSSIFAQTVTLLSDLSNMNTTIYTQTVTLLSTIENVNSTIYTQTVSILANIANLDSDIVAQTTTILTSISNINSTLYDQTVQMLTDISNVNTTIYDQTITMLANIANLDSDIITQTATLISNIENVNSTIYTQTISILSDISNMNTTLYSQTVTMLANIANVNSTLYDQTVTLLADISNIDSDIAAQTIEILADISNVNSTLYSQTVSILSNIVNVNSTIYNQIVTVLSNLDSLNATMYLIDDPTHLNPLVLGYSLSDDYCDFTVVTTWHNATIDIYDNNVYRTGPTSELLSPIRYPLLGTAGTHNLSLYIDGGGDSFWYNISYTVAQPSVFGIEVWDVDFEDVFINILVQTTYRNATLYIYDNGVYKAYSPEAEVIQYRKDSTEGEHVLSIKIDAGGSNVMWRNVTYSVAIMVEEMKIVVLTWDTGSQDSVSGMIQTNWNNATITLTQSGNVVASGSEGGLGLGVPFSFRKTQASGVIHLITVTIDGGSLTIELVLGYSYSDPFVDSGLDPAWLVNKTLDIVEEVLADKVVIPPAVFGGIIGLVILLVTVIIAQLAWNWKGKQKRKKASDLLGMASWLPGI